MMAKEQQKFIKSRVNKKLKCQNIFIFEIAAAVLLLTDYNLYNKGDLDHIFFT